MSLSPPVKVGKLREALHAIAATGRLEVGPPDVLAPVLLAAMHEAATRIADGDPADEVMATMDALICRLTRQ